MHAPTHTLTEIDSERCDREKDGKKEEKRVLFTPVQLPTAECGISLIEYICSSRLGLIRNGNALPNQRMLFVMN
jgi:hypothetical protein